MSSTNTSSEEKQHWLKLVINEMGNHTISIIFMIVLFLLLWVVPQINDLIAVLGQVDQDFIVVTIFFALLSVLAFLISTVNSYFNPPEDADPLIQSEATETSRLSQVKQTVMKIPKDGKELYWEVQKKQNIKKPDFSLFKETQAAYIRRIFPKILGTILILIAAFAVNNTYQKIYESDIIPTGNWGLLICIILLFFTLNQKLVRGIMKWLGKYEWTGYIPITVAVLSFIGILILGAMNNGGSRGDTKRFFLSLILLAIFFLLVSISYNKMVLWFKKNISAPLIISLVIGSLITYIVLFFNPQALKIITPLSIVMICIIGMYTIINVVRFLGHIFDLPILTMTVMLSVALAVYTAGKSNFDHYDASSVKTSILPSDRLDLETYITQWITDRKVDIQNSTTEQPFPIILVSAEGGGSRAGLWSFLVQSYLYDKNPDYFEKYLFSMTGASGGGAGNNMFYSQASQLLIDTKASKLKYESPENDFNYRASSVYGQDYLSTSVASLMGRDLFKSITGLFRFDDRGALLEDEWESQFNSVFNYDTTSGPLGKPYLELMPRLGKHKHTYIRPLIITNTTHLQSGKYAVISPVSIENDTRNMAVFMDLLAEYPDKQRMIKRSTAMSLNARFPYISPAARIHKVGQFGDAGYYDNVGGTVTRRLTAALVNQIQKDSSLQGKYEIKHLLITNFEKQDSLAYSSQLVAPASIMWNATFAHPTEMEETFDNVYNIQSKRTAIKQRELMLSFMKTLNIADDEVIPIIPLGRFLSNAAIRSLEARLEEPEVTKQLDRLLERR